MVQVASTIATAVTVVTGLFGLAGLAGGLAAFFKSKLLDQNLTILERTNKAQADRIKYLEDESARMQTDLNQKQEAIDVLTQIVTGKEQLNQILEAIRAHDGKIEDRDRKLFADLESIVDAMTIIRDKVSLRDSNRPR